jgi:hypothetical protein
VSVELLSRVVRCREALEDGHVRFAAEILYDLEEDLAGGVARVYASNSLNCPLCPATFTWPGQLDHHQLFAHLAEVA